MHKEPTFKELLDHINSSAENSKANCSLGLFVNEFSKDDVSWEDGKVLESFAVKKPAIQISTEVDNNDLFYNVNFIFNSYNDADYKQLWAFITRYVDKARKQEARLSAGEELESVIALTISIIPEKYYGKYCVWINIPFIDMISRTEFAFEKSAVISFLCDESSLGAQRCDDDMVDRRSIEQEVAREMEAQMAAGEGQ